MVVSNAVLAVLLGVSLVAIGGFIYVANGITGLVTANVESGFDYWPLIAGMTGIIGITAVIVAAHQKS